MRLRGMFKTCDKLFVGTYSQGSHSMVIRAKSYVEAEEKLIDYIKYNQPWYDLMDGIERNDVRIYMADEDYII